MKSRSEMAQPLGVTTPKGSNKTLVIISVVIALAVLAGVAYAFTRPDTSPEQAVSEETSRLMEQISKLIVLPEDEVPTIATVSDVEKLKDQPFFARAKNGDKVLIYTQSRKAILFDPVGNKIVEVAPVNLGEVQ